MKIAFAGKGGVGKTSLASWMGDYLARKGKNVWMIDADTALSLGEACGIDASKLPEPLILRKDLVKERIHANGFIDLNPDIDDLPEQLAVDLPFTGSEEEGAGSKKLLVMGAVTNAGGGCACPANALLKAVLANLVIERNDWVLVDLEAGIEHLGRGTVAHVDGLVVVSEPSKRSLNTASEVSELARGLGLNKQTLIINRFVNDAPPIDGFDMTASLPPLDGLIYRQLTDGSVLDLPEQERIDDLMANILNCFTD